MTALILSVLLALQGPVPAKAVRLEGRILREGFTKEQIPPPLTLRLTEILQSERPGPRKVFTVEIGPDGFFEFSGLPAGLYSLYLSPNMLPEAMSISFVDATQDVVDFWLTVPLTSMIVPVKATATLEGAGPLPPFQILLKRINPSEPGVEKKSAQAGNSLEISEVPVGWYAVQVTGLPAGYSLKSIKDGSTDLQSEKLNVHPARPPLLEITLTRSF